jgi:hypothetical protein
MAAFLHQGKQIGPGIPRKGRQDVGVRQVVFQARARLGDPAPVSRPVYESMKSIPGIRSDAIAQDEIMHSPADIEGIYLHETHPHEDSIECVVLGMESERPAVETARFFTTERQGRCGIHRDRGSWPQKSRKVHKTEEREIQGLASEMAPPNSETARNSFSL